ncbi:uncharacterized protein LAJ45_00607 [Morchella importuna]|uniref:uncharacterized protein n=1 Tax=Morchella importuna TaxID=1174673 RepID=UPI001E8CCAE8|nr:uncharacterized protein LAJ45_00607 [Morchella importuna]KAH8155597.1 hypothetical protein LAJ45_00607 [Morchella importuna]
MGVVGMGVSVEVMDCSSSSSNSGSGTGSGSIGGSSCVKSHSNKASKQAARRPRKEAALAPAPAATNQLGVGVSGRLYIGGGGMEGEWKGGKEGETETGRDVRCVVTMVGWKGGLGKGQREWEMEDREFFWKPGRREILTAANDNNSNTATTTTTTATTTNVNANVNDSEMAGNTDRTKLVHTLLLQRNYIQLITQVTLSLKPQYSKHQRRRQPSCGHQ